MYTSVEEIPFNIRLCYDSDDILIWMEKYNHYIALLDNGEMVRPENCLNNAMYARELAFNDCKELPSSRFVESIATVEVTDKQGEVADVESYLKASPEFINDGGIGIEQHSSKMISTIWKAYETFDEEAQKPAIGVCENFFHGHKIFDDAWRGVLEGRLQEKSIGSRIDPEKTQVECDTDGCHTRIYADRWFELSSVFRGANPRTGILDLHESIKGFSNTKIVNINNAHEMCPLKRKYLSFKSAISSVDSDAHVHYIDGDIYIRGKSAEKYKELISQAYPDAICMNRGDFTFILDRAKGEYVDLDVFDELMIQVDGERQAIADYTDALKYIDSTSLSSEQKDMLKSVLQEIISDEEKHIGTLTRAITLLKKEYSDNFYEGMQEAEEEAKLKDDGECPPGQHQHAGVVGCHDEMRSHDSESDEAPKQISISQVPTNKLRDMILATSALLSQYPKSTIDEYLDTDEGKRYIAMYVEYMRRRKASDNTESKKMSEVEETVKTDVDIPMEEEKGCHKEDIELKEAIPEGEKPSEPEVGADMGPIPEGDGSSAPAMEANQEAIPEGDGATELKSDMDLPTAISNISSAIVFMKTKVEAMSARLDGLEDMMKMIAEQKNAPAVDAIVEDVKEEEIEEDVDEKPSPEESDAKSEDKIDVDVKSEDDETKPEDEPEEKVEVEDKTEDKDEDDSKEEESEDKTEVETEDKTPDKGESKEETVVETKDKEEEKKKAEDVLSDILGRSDALTRRKEELRTKGIDMSALQGNPTSITAVSSTVGSSRVSIVDTPAPAPFTPAMRDASQLRTYSFDSVVKDMVTMSNKQFKEKTTGAIRQ